MTSWLETVITALIAVGASSGFWAFFMQVSTRKSATTKLLLGLAHDRIVHLGMAYIERGWITKDEYDDFVKYLYEPYSHFGGNGLAERVMTDVEKLRMVKKYRTVDPQVIIDERIKDAEQ